MNKMDWSDVDKESMYPNWLPEDLEETVEPKQKGTAIYIPKRKPRKRGQKK